MELPTIFYTEMKPFPKILILLFSFYLNLEGNILFAEGTKQLRPLESDRGSIQLQSQNSSGATFAYFGDTKAYQRLNVRICNVGEVVYLGFSQKNNIRLRFFAPDGSLAFGPVTLLAGVQGVINTYQEAVAGPSALPSVGATGYNARSFVATMTGDYYIELENTTPSTNNSSIIDLMDVTVTDAAGVIKNGRLWSSAWLLTTVVGGADFKGAMYVYTDDKITTLVDFNGIQPFEFVISANSTGTGTTGNPENDRKSVKGNQTHPKFKIFLNEPDTLCFETGFIGEVLGEPSITGCPGKYCINVEVSAPGNMVFTVEGNNVPGFQSNTRDRVFQSVLKVGKQCIFWDGLDGQGDVVGKNTPVSMSIQYINGLTNLPMFDVEDHPNGYRVSYVRPKPTTLLTDVTLFWDDSNITGPGAGTIKAGETLVNAITGCDYTPVKQGCHGWSNRGHQSICVAGACSETINTWWYIKESSKSLVYNFEEKKIDANISTPGFGHANDTSVCASTKEIILKGGLSGDSISIWTKVSGKAFGTFEKPDSLRTKYTLSPADANLNVLVLVLSSANPTCANIHDTIQINLEPLPKLTMPSPFAICSNNTTLTTSATIANAGGIVWKSGHGEFLDSLTTSIQYTPSPREIDSSYVKLYATTLPKAGQLCPMVKDSVKISVYLPATLKAPADTVVCQPSTSINLTLKANSINSDSVTWLSNDIVPIKKQGLSPTFSLTNGNAFSIFLTAYKKGCNPIKDTVNVKFEAQPIITASQADTCSPDLRVKLSGTSSLGAAKGTATWTSSGTGSFLLNKDTLTNAYIPSKLDSTAGQVSLKLASKGQVFCPVKDTTFVYKIIPLPKASAGNDTLVCIGSIINRKTIANSDWKYEWRTSPSGSIVSTNPIFTFAASQDTNTFLTVKNSRLCVATDNSVVSIEQKPTISATPTFTCLPNLQVDLVGTSSVTGSGIWSSSGNGNFGSNVTVLSANSYIPSKQDSEKGDVTLKLTSLGQAVCAAAETTFLYKIVPLPKASAGNDNLVCINSAINLISQQNTDWKYEWRRTKQGAILSASNELSFIANLDNNRVYLKVLNSRNCEAQDSAVIATITPPVITVTPSLCLYSAQNILATVANAPSAGSYEWKLNNKSLGISNTNLPIDTGGNYSYHFSFDNGCTSSASMQAFTPPKLIVADASACPNGNITLIANQIPNARYFWGTPGINNGTNKFKITLTAPIPNYKVLVVDQNNCQASDNVRLDISPSPKFSLNGLDLCNGETKKLTATLDPLSNPPLSYSWSRNGVPILASKWEELDYNQGGNYTLTLGIKGCFETNSKTIKINPSPKINMPLVYKHCFETDPALKLSSELFKKYTWISEGNVLDTVQEINVAPKEDTYFNLKVKNNFGCQDSAKLLVRKVCPPRLFVPNVITPESNDVNAALHVFGANYTKFEITVFSRWGEVIFNSKDPENAWTGEYLNAKMPIGNYQWQVTYEGDTEEFKGPYKKTGDVAIIR